MDLEDIQLFKTVVEERGFSAAARVLGLDPSQVSRRMARLERSLNFTLFHRTTRSVGLTQSGRLFFERIAGVPRLIQDAIHAVEDAQDTPSGTIRIAAPPDDGGVIWTLLQGFIHDHPNVDLNIHHTLHHQDLIADEIDIALRGGQPPNTDLFTAHKLFQTRMILAATPEYLALRGIPKRTEDLAEHDGISMGGWLSGALRKVDGDRCPISIHMHQRIQSNSLETTHNAALANLGIAPLLELTCRRALASGTLVEILPGALPDSADFWVIAPLRTSRTAAIDALVRHIIRTAQEIEDGVY